VELFIGTFRHAASPRSWLAQIRAATLSLGPGAVASHRSAMRLRGFKEFVADPSLDISLRGSFRAQPGLIIYRRDEGWRPRAYAVQGIPTSGVTSALFDLAALGDRERLGPAIDYAVLKRWVGTKQLAYELKRIGGSGRRGTVLIRELLAERGEGTESPLETDLAVLLRSSKLPYPEHQVKLFDLADNYITRADFAYSKLRIAIFTDGFETHSGREPFDKDRDVDNELLAMGWLVLRFTHRMVRSQPATVLERIARMLRLRGAEAA
jgi:very-short-patch-repair endonuclease